MEQTQQQNAEPVDSQFSVLPTYDILLRGTEETPIGLYHMGKATAMQLARPHYSEKSVKLVKKRLRILIEQGYVLADATPTARYRSPYYYVLANKGVEYLKSFGYSFSQYYRPEKEVGQSYLHLRHRFGINDILISAALLKKETPNCYLAAFETERDLEANPFKTSWRGTPYKLVPDIFLDLRQSLPGGRQRITPVIVEYDRGTESEEVIRRKVHAYAEMLNSGWYMQRFGTTSITVVFTTLYAERRNRLRRWAREELQNEAHLAQSFLFASTADKTVQTDIWLTPCWYAAALEGQPITLLGG